MVGSRGSFGFRSVGALTLKGLPAPVAVVEVVTGLSDEPIIVPVAEPTAPDEPGPRRRTRNWRAVAVAAVVVVAVVIVLGEGGGSKKESPGQPSGAAVKRNYPVKYVTTWRLSGR